MTPMKHIAIPIRFYKEHEGDYILRDDLTEEEAADLATNYGDQPLSEEELAEFQNREAEWQTTGKIERAKAIHNAPILARLDDVDARSIRPFRANDTGKLAELEAEASTLRSQLWK